MYPSSLSSADRATLTARLAEAEAAYHQLMIGGGVVTLKHNAKEITYSRSSAANLASYIASLRASVGLGGGRSRSRTILF